MLRFTGRMTGRGGVKERKAKFVDSEATRLAQSRAYDAGLRFEYFVAGLTTAGSGYLLVHAEPPHCLLAPEAFMYLGIILLLISALLALAGANNSASVLDIQAEKSEHEDWLVTLDNLRLKSPPYFDPLTNRTLDLPAELETARTDLANCEKREGAGIAIGT